jgi:rubredoxin
VTRVVKTCPKCGATGERVQYVSARVPVFVGGQTVGSTLAGWWACLDCWHKFDGATDNENGVLPAGVAPQREEMSR